MKQYYTLYHGVHFFDTDTNRIGFELSVNVDQSVNVRVYVRPLSFRIKMFLYRVKSTLKGYASLFRSKLGRWKLRSSLYYKYPARAEDLCTGKVKNVSETLDKIILKTRDNYKTLNQN